MIHHPKNQYGMIPGTTNDISCRSKHNIHVSWHFLIFDQEISKIIFEASPTYPQPEESNQSSDISFSFHSLFVF